METRPPYLLLDVDGVLNPFPGPSGSLPPEHRPHRVTYNGNPNVPVWLHPDHGIWLNALHSMNLVRPVWATSWLGEADRLISPRLGLGTLGHIDLGTPADVLTRHPNGHLWKREPVAAWAGNEPLVWIDDDFAQPDHDWAKQRAVDGVPTLLIQPDPYRGLQREHIDAVRMWAIAVMRDLHTNREHDDHTRPGPPVPTGAHTPGNDRPR
ncbi:HAD domain-containing protein [Nocardiopsis sp. FR4]|uniref:HAD domain-containing protein n=1 Tax=Nocardiopsis sp. FR4 TaxID=2605985 RepID=UPI00135BE541|nr:HAD domain-containing protein [Nocardiopsis sp. FR4]